MAREVTAEVPCRPETKELIREEKPPGWEYDALLRHALRTMDPPRQ